MALALFCIDTFRKMPTRMESDYKKRTTGEIHLEWFPNFPILYERARYEADERNSVIDNDALKNACNKDFMSQKYWTAGLWIVTCCCPQKVIYGIKKMVTGESPKFLTDFMMTRAPAGWYPTWVFDAACKVQCSVLLWGPIITQHC